MKKITIIALFCVVHLIHAECSSVSESTEAIIKDYASSIKGREYCGFRKTYSELNVELVIFTVEGACYTQNAQAGSCGNNYVTYLTGIINGKKYPPFVAGGKGKFHVSGIKYIEDRIQVSGKSYKKTDAMCCPSIDTVRAIKVGKNGFESIENEAK